MVVINVVFEVVFVELVGKLVVLDGVGIIVNGLGENIFERELNEFIFVLFDVFGVVV